MKRGFLFITFVAATSVASAAVAEQLIVNSYGGPYEDIIRSRIIEPFEKEFNTKVIYDAVGSASQDYAKIKATRGRPGFDVVVMTASQSLDGCRDGLLEKFSLESVPNIAKLSPEISRIAGACGAVHEVQYLSLLWRKDKLAFAPASWSALFRDELKGKVILPTFQNIMAAYLMQIMSVTNGGDLIDNVDPGFEAMGNLAKQSIGFEQSSSIMENPISSRSLSKTQPSGPPRSQRRSRDAIPSGSVLLRNVRSAPIERRSTGRSAMPSTADAISRSSVAVSSRVSAPTSLPTQRMRNSRFSGVRSSAFSGAQPVGTPFRSGR
jgi:putative spermidine/putrescine transport system substrate-binding protein